MGKQKSSSSAKKVRDLKTKSLPVKNAAAVKGGYPPGPPVDKPPVKH